MNPAVQFITRTGVLLAIALAVQFMRLPQPVTGPLVNAILLLAAIYVGVSSGIIIGLFTPLVAFFVGILAPPLAPLIPVIMAANAILVAVFYGVGKYYNKYLAAVVAAVAKFLTFYVSLNYVLVFLGITLPPALVAAFGLPQLITALVGGFVAALIAHRYPPKSL